MKLQTSIYRLAAAIILIDLLFVVALLNGEHQQAEVATKTSGVTNKFSDTAPQEAQKSKEIELPMGGRKLFPEYTLAALYGTPDNPALGVLGEQSLDASINRAKALARDYQPFTKTKIMPTFEIIATVASADPTENGDYSQEVDLNVLENWIKGAQKEGVYVVLDLQPGHSDFLSQAKIMAPLLKYPNVGLALDPEWRLKPGEVHMEDIGSVDATEVNQVSAWLAAYVKQHSLPQKVLLVHQFRLDMITNTPALNTKYPELAFMVQMDGHGEQSTKQDTWNIVTANYPEGVSFGWKNFVDEDLPMLTPEQTLLKTPAPRFISYQ